MMVPRIPSPRRTFNTTRLALLFVLLLATATASHARVFRRWAASSASTRAIEAIGGKIVYEAAVTINEGKGSLVVFQFGAPIENVVQELNRAFKTDAAVPSGGNMAMAAVSSSEAVLRFVAVQMPDPSKTMVFTIEQTLRESRNSGAPPARHMMEDIPAYPQSEPVFFIKDENAGMSMAVAKTRSSPENVREFYNAEMPRLGWTPALQPKDPGGDYPALADARLRVFHRGAGLCCVFADASSEPGETRITLLHKQRGMK